MKVAPLTRRKSKYGTKNRMPKLNQIYAPL